jgi:hypothetical protein
MTTAVIITICIIVLSIFFPAEVISQDLTAIIIILVLGGVLIVFGYLCAHRSNA